MIKADKVWDLLQIIQKDGGSRQGIDEKIRLAGID